MSENTAAAATTTAVATPATQDAAPARKPAARKPAATAKAGKGKARAATNGKPASKGKPAAADKPAGKSGLRVPQARILKALEKGAKLSRAKLTERIGFSAGSGAVGLAMGGNRNAGGNYDGLVPLGLIKRVELDVDGAREVAYEITPKGRKALSAFLAGLPKGRLPAVRDSGNGD